MKRGKFKLCVAKMPVLRHSFPDQPYDVMKSEVVAWLITQPECLERLYQEAVGTKEIVYDKGRGTWCGLDFGFEEEVVVDE